MIVASRYAKSLMELATENRKVDVVREDMKKIVDLFKNSRDFELFVNSPVVKTAKKVSVIKEVLSGKVSDLTLSFILLITNKNRERYIREIAQAFDEEYKKNKNIFTAVVTSAQGLDSKTRAKVLDLVKEQMKGEVELVEKIDPSTIGGFILKIGDKQIDKTVARQLSNIKKQLVNQALN